MRWDLSVPGVMHRKKDVQADTGVDGMADSIHRSFSLGSKLFLEIDLFLVPCVTAAAVEGVGIQPFTARYQPDPDGIVLGGPGFHLFQQSPSDTAAFAVGGYGDPHDVLHMGRIYHIVTVGMDIAHYGSPEDGDEDLIPTGV